MTPEEEDLAKEIYAAIMAYSNESERSQQAKRYQLGISDLGFCHERVRRVIDQQVPEDTDALAAFLGTAIGDHAEKALAAVWPNAVTQGEVTVTLTSNGREFTLPGHPDVMVTEEALILDGKTDYGLADVERSGASLQQRFQRHLYGYAAWVAGVFGEIPLEQVRVGNFWIDRAGIDKRVHVELEHCSIEVVQEAADWLGDVVYAVLHDEEAQKDPPRTMCEQVCGFYKVCRAFDTDVEGLITDDLLVRNIAQYDEGRAMEKEGRRLKDQAKQHLQGVSGRTEEFTIRWTNVNATVVPSFERKGYSTLDVKRVKK